MSSSAESRLGDAVNTRDRRAATEAMVVVLEAPDLARVYSGESSEYVVDARGPACECADYRYRDVQCKHIRRVKMALGIREIPEGVRVDPALAKQRESFQDGGRDAV
jgi:predicted nucleic acid-binding Zn finger protein